jgi:hypothetical protein
MPVGLLYDRYVTQSAVLRVKDAAAAAASLENGQRPWMVPDLGDGSFTIPGLADAYDRSEMSEAYSLILTQPGGTQGDAMAAKLQSDYLASQERAYRLRQSGPVRCAMHAAARRQAHGAVNGVFGRVDAFVQDLIMAGAANYVGDE